MSLCRKTKTNAPLMYEVPNKDMMKSEIMPHSSVVKHGYASKREWAEAIQCSLHKQKTACRWPITSAFPRCCCRCMWAACPATARAGCCKRTSFRCRCALARACSIIIFVMFSVENLTLWVPFFSPIVHLAAKNRFSRGFVLMQNGVNMWMQWNEYLFKKATICTNFRAIYSKT